MDCPNKILPSGTPAQHQMMAKICHTRSSFIDTAEKIQTGETCPDHSLGIADITAPAIMTCTEAAPDCNKGKGTSATEAAQGDPIQHTKATATEPTMTHHTSHTTDHPHTTAH